MSQHAADFDFEPLEKLSLGENIARHLQELLLNGTLRPGDLLPSQRELASRFGTSVAVVREATSILSAAGLLDARPGRGTVVLAQAEQPPSVNLWLGTVHDAAEALAFLETRQVLEHYTLRRAAQCATPEQIAGLHASLGEMHDARSDAERFIEADLTLHFRIAEAAGNPVVTRLLRAIHLPLANVLRAVSQQLMQQGRFPTLYLNHQHIVAGIEAHDPAAAVAAFDRMLAQTLDNDTLGRALNPAVQLGAPLGEGFLADLHWNLTRLIGPMAEVIMHEAASSVGTDPGQLSRAHLAPYLSQIARQLPAAKQGEWQALAELLQQRYDGA